MQLYNNTLKNEPVHQRFYNSARQMGLTRNKAWLQKMIFKDKIFYYNSDGDRRAIFFKRDQEAFRDKLFQLIDVFERKYDNNWDIHLDYDPGVKKFEISFLVNYEKVTITNSRNQSRELTNLLVILPLAYNSNTQNVYVRQIQGTRITLEEDEWFSGYVHSHLPSINRIENAYGVFPVNEFCIGTEDLSELEIELSVDFDIEKFELMLYTIDSLVSWESLEGVPHKHMQTVVAELVERRLTLSSNDMQTLYSMLHNYLTDLPSLPFDFVFVNDHYQIKNNTKFNDVIKDAFLNDYNLKTYVTNVLCKRGTDNHFYSHTALENAGTDNSHILTGIKNEMDGQLPFIYIQGKPIHFNINFLGTNNRIDIAEYNVYPKFLAYVSEQLESEIYKACVRGSSINKLSNTGDNVRRVSEENQVFV